MLLGIYKNRELVGNPRLAEMEKALVADGNELYSICSREDVRKGTDMVLSVGGDGTFLSASKRVADSGIPILGVNLGRLGFLSENRPEDIPAALKNADYELENRTMLKASLPQTAEVPDSLSFWPYALNEITVHRSGAAMLGINVSVGTACRLIGRTGFLSLQVLVPQPTRSVRAVRSVLRMPKCSS
mgnify:CR=1 FL=1